MSLVIDIDNFPNFSSIFEEIERRNRENRQNKPRAFTTMELGTAEICNQERKSRSCRVIQRESTKCEPNCGRRSSDPTGARHSPIPSRIRIRSAPCPSIDRAILKDEPRLTEAAKELSNEELALLYEDILKPLDFYSTLFTRLNLTSSSNFTTSEDFRPDLGFLKRK